MSSKGRGKHVAFATSSEWRSLTAEDQLVAEYLREHGLRVTAACWEDRRVDWRSFDAVVIRSCWDYHLRLQEFGAWLDRLDWLSCAVWNPTRMLRWNSRKTYLEDLHRHGVETVPTLYLPHGSEADLGELMDRLASDELIVKPTVAASAYGAWRVERCQIADLQERLNARLGEHELMAQPLVREVLDDGEWSLVFLGGELSHAVKKQPRVDDFRVQEELGGSSFPSTPPRALVTAARRALDRVEGPTLYARVDLVEVAGRGVLMELELIEPWLFLDTAPQSLENFRRALVAWL